MQVEQLSDKQLYALYCSITLTGTLKRIVVQEFKRRNFTPQQLDELALAQELVHRPDSKTGLPLAEKILIVLFPFFAMIHAIVANRHIAKGNMKRWKQHWRFVIIGYAVWIVALLLFARYYLFNGG